MNGGIFVNVTSMPEVGGIAISFDMRYNCTGNSLKGDFQFI